MATLSFAERGEEQSISPIARYLLNVISIKRSNLCVSVDVHTTAQLLQVADEVGDSICLLKTHADIIDDFSERTIRGLQEISQRKHFLIFEDRKLGDIGNTVQAQYIRGPLRICQWAHIVNAHLLPGPTIIPALRSAAQECLSSLNRSVATTISTGTPRLSLDSNPDAIAKLREDLAQPGVINDQGDVVFKHHRSNSKSLSATTTISQTYESTSARPPPALLKSLSSASEDDMSTFRDTASALEELGPPPHARGLLLLAQMSNEGNLATGEYTKACVKAARENKDFVVGFICQQNLNSEEDDFFLSLAPGVGMPKKGEGEANGGDGKGQVWRTPETVVGKDGVDIVIVGRGILRSENRAKEAERYRKAAWAAYDRKLIWSC